MRNKQWVYIIILIAFLNTFSCKVYSESANPVPKLDGAAAVLLDEETGQILFKYNENQRLHISSASKMMTALIAIEKVKLDAKITISKEASKVNGSILSLEAGEKFYAEDLINTIMLSSANDAATALAEHISGEAGKFAGEMNDRAIKLDMKDTRFINPTGLYHQEQYTTARDLAVFMKHALQNPVFKRMFSNKGQPFNSKIITSRNKLFWSYDGVSGGKAGYNETTKQTAITSAVRENQKFVAIILDSPEESVWNDSIKLLDYGFENYGTSILVSKGQVLKRVGMGDKVIGLVTVNDVKYTHPRGKSFIKRVDFDIPKELKPPILKSNPIGTAKYVLNDGNTIEIQLYTDKEIQLEKSIMSKVVQKLKDTGDLLVIVILMLTIEIMLIIRKIYLFVRRRTVRKSGTKGRKESDI